VSKKRDLTVYCRIVLDRKFIETHTVEECKQAFRVELETGIPQLKRVALARVIRIKEKGRL